MVRVEGVQEDIYPVVEAVGMWESRRDFQRRWEAGIMASMFSILCHFPDLLFAGKAGYRTRHETFVVIGCE
jgi:hypothetical protein